MTERTGCLKTFIVVAIEYNQKTKADIESIFELESQKVKPFGNRMPENAFMLTTEGRVQSTSLIEHLKYLLLKYDKELDNIKRLNKDLKVKFFIYWESEHGNGGPNINEDLLELMGSKNIDLIFEFY